MRQLAPAFARAGNVQAALDAATGLDDIQDQLRVVQDVVAHLPPGGEDGALEVARPGREATRRTQDPVARARFLGELVLPLGRVNERAALEVSRGRADPVGLRPSSLGVSRPPSDWWSSSPEGPDRDDQLREIASGWAADGRADRARELIERVSPGSCD